MLEPRSIPHRAAGPPTLADQHQHCSASDYLDAGELLRQAVLLRHQAAVDRADAAVDRNIAALWRHQAALDHAAARRERDRCGIDELTGVLSRSTGIAALNQELARCRRGDGHLTIGFFDVDGLKHTNDTKGHIAGDELLRRAGFHLRALVRSYDVIVRYGGDEFVCSLGDTDLASAELRFKMLQSNLTARLPEGRMTAGFAELRPGETLEEIIDRADRAMYAKRRLQKNRRPRGLGGRSGHRS